MACITTTTTTNRHQRRSSLQVIAGDPIIADDDTSAKEVIAPLTVKSPVANTMTQSVVHGVCVSILYLIHMLYMAYIAQKVLRTNAKQQWQNLLLAYQPLADDKQSLARGHSDRFYSLLKDDQRRLTKLPGHLAITLSTELLLDRTNEDWTTIIQDLGQVACWAWEMGIKELSVFDASGTLKSRAVEIAKQQSMALHQWKQHYHSDLIPENDFQCSILSLEDAQSYLVHATQKAYQHHLKNEEIDIEWVDGVMQASMTDPDLMIVYDGLPHHYISLDGYSPWHIRLTEFILNYDLFISSLFKYARVEQRFGR
ncbi:hypothetical protein [Absidia glauca]|uniref:ditrans,polycis-polyprenyl diphosphate synthase [(2E,6E)-farnesyldiphosphate specific] n=1 Tax=Absidia glauca TaxID=4829 RepID=A0A163J9B9_ABSGL|nr:hypothetical protein [Absidia glauca]